MPPRIAILVLLPMALGITAEAPAQDLLDCDFSGTDPALNTPWTATELLRPGFVYSGWSQGPGLASPAGIDDALGFSLNAGPSVSDLGSALADGEYLGFTLAPPPGGLLDLGGLEVSLTTRRLDWHAPRTYALFTSVDGFSPGQELFTTPPAGHGDQDDRIAGFVFPLAGYDGITGPVEFRLYAFDAQYAGHRSSLRDFSITDPGPVHPFTLQAGPGGSVASSPAGTLFATGTTVTVWATPAPGHRFVGWSDAVTGTGNPRTLVVGGPTTVTASFAPSAVPAMKLGTNLPAAVDWTTAWIFVDQMKLAREWLTRSVGGSEWDSGFSAEIPVDAQGYPTQVPFVASDGQSHYVHTIVPTPEPGKYTFEVAGSGTLSVAHPVSTGAITLTGGTTTFAVIIPAGEDNLFLRLESSSAADPVRNLRILRPGFEETAAAQPFHPLFLSRLSRFSNLRFMDMGRTNGSGVVSWSDRTRPDSYTQTRDSGIALEYLIDLANHLEVDPWFCIPHLADDGYVTQCARLIRDRLDPSLRVWVEYSNETWNGIFSQAGHVNAEGLAQGLAPDPFTAGHYFHARRSAQIWAIFASEFVDDSRLVNVLAAQSANPATSALRLAGVVDPAINPAQVMPDVLAIAPYFGTIFTPGDLPPSAPSYPTLDELFSVTIPAELGMVQAHVAAQRALADLNGLELVGYEAGQHFVGTLGAENDGVLTALLHAANRDPRMKAAYLRYLDLLQGGGVSLTDHFSYCGRWSKWGSWGALEFQSQPLEEAPKHAALVEWRPALPGGAPAPAQAVTGR